MSVELLEERREKRERGQSLETRVSALENYIAMLIGSGDILDGAVTTPKLLDGCVEELKIAADAVTNAKIAVDAIQGDVIKAGAITESKLYTGAVTANKIGANAVTAAKIYANTITASQIAAGTITATEIKANTITAAKIATGTITADEIDVSTITTLDLTAGSIIGVEIKTGTSGQRTVISGSTIKLYDSDGHLRLESFGGQGTYSFFDSSGDLMGGIEGNKGSSSYGLRFLIKEGPHSAKNVLNLYDDRIETNGTLNPEYNDTDNLGRSDLQRWNKLYVKEIRLSGVTRSTWPSASSGANTALSNLTTTSINKSLIPSTGTIDLGSAAKEWNTLWLNSGSSIYWGTTSHYLIYDGTDMKFSDNLDMTSKKIMNIADPGGDNDATRKGYVQWMIDVAMAAHMSAYH